MGHQLESVFENCAHSVQDYFAIKMQDIFNEFQEKKGLFFKKRFELLITLSKPHLPHS